jgi:hypothetical protein
MPDDPMRRAVLVVRGGLLVAAVAGVLIALAPLLDLAEGPASSPEGSIATAGVGASVGLGAGLGAALLAAAAALRLLWAHLAGLVVATALALVAALLVISARRSDTFAEGADITLRGGGLLLIAGFWIALAAVAVSLFGVRLVAQAGPEPTLAPGRIQRARTAPLAAILGIAGVVIVVTSALAAAYGVLALGDIRASGDRLLGRGMATTGLVLGLLMLSLLAAVGGVGALTASP